MRFRDHAAEVLAVHAAGPATLAAYGRDLRNWVLPAVGDVPVARLGRRDVDGVLAEVRGAGRRPASVRAVLMATRVIMRKAVEWGRAAADPTQGIRVGLAPAPPKVLSREQAAALERVLGVDPASRVLRLILATGLRLGEALAVRPDHVDRDRAVLRVLDAKSPAGVREVDLPDRVAGLRLDHRGTCPRAVRRALRAACDRAGVPAVRVHDLRHTRATALLLAGAPALYVSRQLGHATPAFTMKVYGHLAAATPEERRGWANL